MLFWCPIGVRKAQDAPIATAIKKLSGFTPSVAAMPRAIGHKIAAVAALFMTSDRNIVVIKTTANAAIGLPWQ